jgi:hypothetical protein
VTAGKLPHKPLRGGVRLYSDDRGELRIWSPRRGLIASQFSGRLSKPVAEAIASYSDEQFALVRPDVKFSGFHDWAEMLSYDSAARQSLMQWTLAARGRISELHFLVSSSLVHMALTVGDLALSLSIQSYREREPFEQRFAAAVAG